jgi:organic radical activating enzyme
MFGKNPISTYRTPAEGFLLKTIFLSIQGEGPFSGCPSLFVRFAGCSHKCAGCDTDFDGGDVLNLETLVSRIESRLPAGPDYRIVLSGGEPMLQPLTELIIALRSKGHKKIDIETAGTNWPVGFERVVETVNIICSPKTAHIDYRIADAALAFKYVVRAGFTDTKDGLPLLAMWTEHKKLPIIGQTQLFRPGYSMPSEIYVQPFDSCDEEDNKRNLKACAEVSMLHGYRFSVQLHKLLNME